MNKENDKFIMVSLGCIFLLVMMISFGAVNVKGTYSAMEEACYTCNNEQSGKYLWGDYSSDNSCNKMSSYTTKETCLTNNCASGEKLDSNGNCINNSGLATILYKSGSLTIFRTTCELENGSCKVTIPKYKDAIGWSLNPNCTNVVKTEEIYLTITSATTHTYYLCNEDKGSTNDSNSSSSQQPNDSVIDNNNNNTNTSDTPTSDNPETGSAFMIIVFLGIILMGSYTIYVYKNGIKE